MPDATAAIALHALLDRSYTAIQEASSFHQGMSELMEGLWRIRQGSERHAWLEVLAKGRLHPLCTVVHQDPMTEWCFRKPRGYPGDAALLDHAYQIGELVDQRLSESTPTGKAVYEWLLEYSGVRGIQERRAYLAELIDETAATQDTTTILSIACGHLREAALSTAVREKHIARFVAVDQDERSLRQLSRDYHEFSIETVRASIRDLIVTRPWSCEFNLVYAAGLFDYLPTYLAQVFLEVMFSMLKVGGRLIIANAIPSVVDTGYLEMFMDWHLLYRSLDNLKELTDRLPRTEALERRVWSQASGHFGYLEVWKQR